MHIRKIFHYDYVTLLSSKSSSSIVASIFYNGFGGNPANSLKLEIPEIILT